MKKILLSGFVLTLLVSCGGSDAVKAEDVQSSSDSTLTTGNTTEVSSTSYNVDVTKSILGWKGSAVGKSHNGTVNITEGKLDVVNGSIAGGEFVFDMKTINALDQEGDWKTKLETHLGDSTFFNVEKFPEAKLLITGSSEGIINASLTIRDVTKSIKFPVNVEIKDDKLDASAKFTINRTDFGVVYGSGSLFDIAKDNAISDDIDFDVTVSASK